LAELEMISTTTRLTNFHRDISWNSQTWLANGWFQGINAANENGDINATGCQVDLAGVPSSTIALILSELNHSKRGTIYLGFLDGSNEASVSIIGTPLTLFKGFCDVPILTDNSERAAISISYESELIRMDKTKSLRMTAESQAARFPGDKGFDYAALIEDWTGFWGKSIREKWVNRRRIANRRDRKR
jgi:hypothetical protein